jgi:hypothetical protein
MKQHKCNRVISRDVYNFIGEDKLIKEFAYEIISELDIHQIKTLLNIKIIDPLYVFLNKEYEFDSISGITHNDQIKLESTFKYSSEEIEFYLKTDNSLVKIKNIHHSDGDVENLLLRNDEILCREVKSCLGKIIYYSDYLGNVYNINLMNHECPFTIKDLINNNFENIFNYD